MSSSSSQPGPDRWWHFLLAVLLLPVSVPLFLLLVLGSIPVCMAVSIEQGIREDRYRRRLHEAGRWRAWEEVEARLLAGEGTLLIEQGQKMPGHFWWTPEDVPGAAPVPPPAEKELDVFGLRPPHPFVAWCHDRYLEPTRGTAVLTEPPFALPPGLFFAEFFRQRYPQACVVDTVYCRAVGAEPRTGDDRTRGEGSPE
jgi:hypothetical protein